MRSLLAIVFSLGAHFGTAQAQTTPGLQPVVEEGMYSILAPDGRPWIRQTDGIVRLNSVEHGIFPIFWLTRNVINQWSITERSIGYFIGKEPLNDMNFLSERVTDTGIDQWYIAPAGNNASLVHICMTQWQDPLCVGMRDGKVMLMPYASPSMVAWTLSTAASPVLSNSPSGKLITGDEGVILGDYRTTTTEKYRIKISPEGVATIVLMSTNASLYSQLNLTAPVSPEPELMLYARQNSRYSICIRNSDQCLGINNFSSVFTAERKRMWDLPILPASWKPYGCPMYTRFTLVVNEDGTEAGVCEPIDQLGVTKIVIICLCVLAIVLGVFFCGTYWYNKNKKRAEAQDQSQQTLNGAEPIQANETDETAASSESVEPAVSSPKLEKLAK